MKPLQGMVMLSLLLPRVAVKAATLGYPITSPSGYLRCRNSLRGKAAKGRRTLYWCPCFGKDGYGTHYNVDQSAVDVYQFVPVRVKVAGLPGPGKDGKKPSPLKLSAEWNPPQSTTFVFRATSPRYGKVLASCLKNLLSELER